MNKPAIDVAYVAELARLELTDEEKAVFQPQLEDIVRYVEKISSVDVEGVPPTMHGRAIVNALREDEVRPSMPREEALANAPARTGDEFSCCYGFICPGPFIFMESVHGSWRLAS